MGPFSGFLHRFLGMWTLGQKLQWGCRCPPKSPKELLCCLGNFFLFYVCSQNENTVNILLWFGHRWGGRWFWLWRRVHFQAGANAGSSLLFSDSVSWWHLWQAWFLFFQLFLACHEQRSPCSRNASLVSIPLRKWGSLMAQTLEGNLHWHWAHWGLWAQAQWVAGEANILWHSCHHWVTQNSQRKVDHRESLLLFWNSGNISWSDVVT